MRLWTGRSGSCRVTEPGRTRELLRSYLRQRQELGQSEIVLAGGSAAEVLQRLRHLFGREHEG